MKLKVLSNLWKPKSTTIKTLEAPNIAWLPFYTLKKHPRAKRVKMRASASSGIVVTIPPRFNLKYLVPILEEHKDWLLTQLKKFSSDDDTFPKEITLLDEKWTIQLQASPGRSFVNHKLKLIQVSATENAAIKNKLTHAFKLIAKAELIPMLDCVSKEINIAFKSASIRSPKTIWGSCSDQKTISLNYRLIFFPSAIIRYVMVHELCHTIHMNHTSKFWNLVAQHDKQCREHRRILKQSDDYIPSAFRI